MSKPNEPIWDERNFPADEVGKMTDIREEHLMLHPHSAPDWANEMAHQLTYQTLRIRQFDAIAAALREAEAQGMRRASEAMTFKEDKT